MIPRDVKTRLNHLEFRLTALRGEREVLRRQLEQLRRDLAALQDRPYQIYFVKVTRAGDVDEVCLTCWTEWRR